MKFVLLFFVVALTSCKSSQSESSSGNAEDDQGDGSGPIVLPEIVTYSGPVEEEKQSPDGSAPNIKRSPSDSLSKVIEANGGKPEAVPMDQIKPAYPTATPVPDKPGFVYNPWTQEPVDVRGLPPGSLVKDPNDPDPKRKFRTPAP